MREDHSARLFFRTYLRKWRTASRTPLQVNLKDAAAGILGGFLTVALLMFLSDETHVLWIMAPFGGSCVLAFGIWDSPYSQPRNIIGGHLLTALVGLAVLHTLGVSEWSYGLAVGLGIGLMMLTKTTHPPAGGNPLVVMMGAESWQFLFVPVLAGSLWIVLMALLLNNLHKERQYPVFWL